MRLPVAALALLTAGCLTTEMRSVASTPAPEVRVGARARMWEVRSGGELVGRVVLFQEHGAARDSVYVVRNPWHQDLGLIDGLGRAYRYIPHEEQPAWVGSGTVLQGTERILGAHDCELTELAGEATKAAPAPGSTPDASAPPSAPPHAAEGASSGGGLAQSR